MSVLYSLLVMWLSVFVVIMIIMLSGEVSIGANDKELTGWKKYVMLFLISLLWPIFLLFVIISVLLGQTSIEIGRSRKDNRDESP